VDALQIPFWTGLIAQLLANVLGRGQTVTVIVVLLYSGMSPLLALFYVHASQIPQHGLASLLHARLRRLEQPPNVRLITAALSGALLALMSLLWLSENSQRAIVLLGVAVLGYGLLPQKCSAKRTNSALVAGALAALCGSAGAMHRGCNSTAMTTSTTLLLVSALSVVLCGTAQSPSLLPLLGLLAGAVLAAPFGPALWTPRKSDKTPILADY
jgi:uncharacterized membrane protein YfcA